jgi:hypothetical protein
MFDDALKSLVEAQQLGGAGGQAGRAGCYRGRCRDYNAPGLLVCDFLGRDGFYRLLAKVSDHGHNEHRRSTHLPLSP